MTEFTTSTNVERIDPQDDDYYFLLQAASRGENFPTSLRGQFEGRLTAEDRRRLRFDMSKEQLLREILMTDGVAEVVISSKNIEVRCSLERCKSEVRLRRLLSNLISQIAMIPARAPAE